jgi:hypothetical protein
MSKGKAAPVAPVELDGVSISVMDIDDIEPDPLNPNKGTPRGRAVTDFSIDTFKPARGIALDKDNMTLAGNKTVDSARRAGVKRVIVVETEGDVLVATRRRDMDLDDPEDTRAREYTVADNRAGELGLAWDADNIAAAANEGADFSVLFYDDELGRLTGDGGEYWEEDESFGEDQQDLVPEMALQPFEHYDYLLVIFRSTLDWSRALDLMADLGLVKKAFTVSKKTRKIGLCRVVDGGQLMDKLAEAKGGVGSHE